MRIWPAVRNSRTGAQLHLMRLVAAKPNARTSQRYPFRFCSILRNAFWSNMASGDSTWLAIPWAALLLACDGGNSILSFTNIEGNLAPEDCFLSRQILEQPAGDPDGFLKTLADRAWQSRTFSHRLFASALPYKVRTEAVAPIFRSMVEITDNERLLAKFTGLACPTMFVYGDQNRSLSYLGTLMRRGVQLAEIERSGHWPMYANPPALWARIGQFIEQAEMEDSHE
jgi:pimeloyl-ACP methyl ester carboxylesterase